MNVKKYVSIGIGVFILIVLLAIGISAKFTFSNITSNPYMFIENFFSQWSSALSAAGTLIVALLAVWAIYESHRSQERERERAIHALHDEIHWNISDVITLRFQISEWSKKLEEFSTVITENAPFQPIDTAVFDSMKNSGQLHWLREMRMDIVFCYKLIRMYNQDAGFEPRQVELLANLQETLDKAIRALEGSFTFLPRYLKEADKGQQTKAEREDQRGSKLKQLDRDKYFLLPFVIIVLITVGILIAIAFLHPLDSEFTLAIRWSYVCYGLAGVGGLLAALLSAQKKWVGMALIIAIELFVGGMPLQLSSLI